MTAPAAMPARRGPLVALRMIFAAVMLIVVWRIGGSGAAAIPAAISVTIAITGAWILGPRSSLRGAAHTRGVLRMRIGRWLTGAFFVSLASGSLLAAGVFSGPPPAGAPLGLPLSLLGLLFGVFLLPLALTSVGFALSFRPPAPEGLAALRRAAKERAAARNS